MKKFFSSIIVCVFVSGCLWNATIANAGRHDDREYRQDDRQDRRDYHDNRRDNRHDRRHDRHRSHHRDHYRPRYYAPPPRYYYTPCYDEVCDDWEYDRYGNRYCRRMIRVEVPCR